MIITYSKTQFEKLPLKKKKESEYLRIVCTCHRTFLMHILCFCENKSNNSGKKNNQKPQ